MTDDDQSDDEPLMVECDIHGTRPSAVVCGHLIQSTKTSLGFIENSSDPDDLQAWCDACERMFVREQELTEAFRKFNDMAVVCDGCYARIRTQHSAPSKKKFRAVVRCALRCAHAQLYSGEADRTRMPHDFDSNCYPLRTANLGTLCTVKWVVRSPDFPGWVEHDRKLSGNSHAADLFKNKFVPPGFQRVPQEA